jgi:hypothetical protein
VIKDLIHGVHRGSVLIGQHDGNDPLGQGRIRWIRRMVGEGPIVVIDLEEDRVALGFERSEVMFFVRIIGVAEVIIRCDCLDNSVDAELARAVAARSQLGTVERHRVSRQ